MFKIGERVQLHPVTGAWMRGDRYGEVVKLGRLYIHVKMDRSHRVLKFRIKSELLMPI
jgi:hypothetical protein